MSVMSGVVHSTLFSPASVQFGHIRIARRRRTVLGWVVVPIAAKKEGNVQLSTPVASLKDLDAILAYRHDQLLRRYVLDHQVSAVVAEKRFTGLKQFLAVCARMPGQKVTSDEIDSMWHTFLLFGRDYRQFCGDYLGRVVDHQPFEAPNPSKYMETRTFAERLCGALDDEVWPRQAKGDCSSGCE